MNAFTFRADIPEDGTLTVELIRTGELSDGQSSIIYTKEVKKGDEYVYKEKLLSKSIAEGIYDFQLGFTGKNDDKRYARPLSQGNQQIDDALDYHEDNDWYQIRKELGVPIVLQVRADRNLDLLKSSLLVDGIKRNEFQIGSERYFFIYPDDAEVYLNVLCGCITNECCEIYPVKYTIISEVFDKLSHYTPTIASRLEFSAIRDRSPYPGSFHPIYLSSLFEYQFLPLPSGTNPIREYPHHNTNLVQPIVVGLSSDKTSYESSSYESSGVTNLKKTDCYFLHFADPASSEILCIGRFSENATSNDTLGILTAMGLSLVYDGLKKLPPTRKRDAVEKQFLRLLPSLHQTINHYNPHICELMTLGYPYDKDTFIPLIKSCDKDNDCRICGRYLKLLKIKGE